MAAVFAVPRLARPSVLLRRPRPSWITRPCARPRDGTSSGDLFSSYDDYDGGSACDPVPGREDASQSTGSRRRRSTNAAGAPATTRRLSVEHREAISRALKGRKKPAGFMSEVHKAKIKATQKSRKKPEDFMAEEHRKKISESMRKAWARRKAKAALEAAAAAAADDVDGVPSDDEKGS
ncbi:hypothetical protein HOP50_02g14740 [Chloropicon primus]|nr:hypothetical protein HOP50_02g14740 [Chloropicon primus]